MPKDVRLNSTHFFIMKISNKRELQQSALNHSSDIDFTNFIKIYKKCTARPYSFLVNDTKSYFRVPKDVRLNSTHFFIMKISNKRELQQSTLNHSSDIDFTNFIKIYKKCTARPYSFLVNDTTLASDSPLRFRKNLSN